MIKVGDYLYIGNLAVDTRYFKGIAQAVVCVFRSIPATDSGRSRPPIPVEVGRLIRYHPGRFGRCCRNASSRFPLTTFP
jgi:hypothetical protein